MQIRILGSAAGGGLPQWNCCCENCAGARAGVAGVRSRTQSSVAISADGESWFLLNASADVRAQIGSFSSLWPPAQSRRGTAIAGCVLTDAEIDHTTGLLQLREGLRIGVYSTPIVRRWLHEFLPIGPILSQFADRPWTEIAIGEPLDLSLPDGRASGLSLTAFEVGRDVPRFVPEEAETAVGSVIGMRVVDSDGRALVYAPGVATICDELRDAAQDADCILVDGTFWSDQEPIEMGIKQSTATMMGHVPVSGENGTLQWLSGLPARHRTYVHINNTNPMLMEDGPEHRQVVATGVRVGMDGDQITI